MKLRWTFFISLFLFLVNSVYSKKIENSIRGDPIVECTGSSIRFRIVTASVFMGRIFVQGNSKIPGCEIRASGSFAEAGIEVPFDSPCKIDRIRSINPRGVFVTTTIVVSFHPMFITNADRAIRVQCQYQAAEKHVGANFRVNELPWQKHAEPIEMPVCRYEILADSPNGALVSVASVGQRVYHKWTCETSTPEFFCMLVHSCTVEDGHGSSMLILNEAGCAVDDILLRDLNYTGLEAGQTTLVYKYADYDTLFFQCQVSITVKDPSDVNQLARGCPAPICGSNNESTADLAGIHNQMNNEIDMLQVRQPRESVKNETTIELLITSPVLHTFENLDVTANLLAIDTFNQPQMAELSLPKSVCFSGVTLVAVIFIIILVSISSVVVFTQCTKQKKKKNSTLLMSSSSLFF